MGFWLPINEVGNAQSTGRVIGCFMQERAWTYRTLSLLSYAAGPCEGFQQVPSLKANVAGAVARVPICGTASYLQRRFIVLAVGPSSNEQPVMNLRVKC